MFLDFVYGTYFTPLFCSVEFNPPHMADPVVKDTLEVPSTSFTKKERQEFLAELPDIIR